MSYLKLLLFTLLPCLIFNLNAQKVKLKDLDVKVNYIKFPVQGFTSDINSYSVNITCDEQSLANLGYTKSGLASGIKIPGYVKFDEKVGVVVDILITGPTGSTVNFKTDNKKDKDGKTWQEFSYQVSFSGNALVKLIDKNKKLLTEYSFPASEIQSSQVFRASSEAEKDFKSRKEDFYKNGRKSILEKIWWDINSRLKYDFGIDFETDNVELRTLKEKDHPQYQEYVEMEKVVTDAFKRMTYDNNGDFISALQPAIQFWKEKEPMYSGTDKEQKKLKYACQMNLAQCYYWMDDLDNATLYAQMVANGDEDEKDGKKFLEKINKLKEWFTKLNRTSRHFKIEASETDIQQSQSLVKEKEALIASGDITAFPDFNSKMSVNSKTSIEKGIYYHNSGKIDTGYFAFEALDGKPDFRMPDNIRFGYLLNGQIAVGTPAYARTKGFSIGETYYTVQDVKIGSALGSVSMKNAIVEVIQDYKRTSLLIIYPPFKNANSIFSTQNEDLKPEIVVYNKEDKEYLPTDGIFGPDKALISIVDGCPLAEEYAKQKKEQTSKKSIFSRLSATVNVDTVKEALIKFDTCK